MSFGFIGIVSCNLVPSVRPHASAVESQVIQLISTPLTRGTEDLPPLIEPTTVLSRDGSVLGHFDGLERRRSVRLHALPQHVWRAILAAEDRAFYQHAAVDPSAIARALVRNARRATTQGASTIAQQLAKLNYTDRQRTIVRKLTEFRHAVALENRYSKDELLERYVNQVYFGNGAYGIEEAAQTFFGVTAPELTVAKAATLAGLIHSPETLDPTHRPSLALERRNRVLVLMREAGWLTGASFREARLSPLSIVTAAPSTDLAIAAPFLRYVRSEALSFAALGPSVRARATALETRGYTIETTLDAERLKSAATAVKQVIGPGPSTGVMAGVEPGDGAIRLLFDGLDPTHRFNVASDGQLAPGGIYDPILYLAALQLGSSPSPKLLASSYRTKGCEQQSPRSDACQDTAAAAFAFGLSLDAISRVGEQLGISPSAFFSGPCAPSPDARPTGVSPLALAAAYAAFAKGGVYAPPYAISRVRDRTGRLVYERRPQPKQAVSPQQTTVLNAALARPSESRDVLSGDVPIRYTSTTSDRDNGWLVGYTATLSTAVWVGDPDREGPSAILESKPDSPAVIFGKYLDPASRFGTDTPKAPELIRATQVGQPNEVTSSTPDTLASLGEKIRSILGASTAKRMGATAHVDGVGTIELNGPLLLPPASTQKLYLATAALLRLGPEYRIRTRVMRSGVLGRDGVLTGNLTLVAAGDPLLRLSDLRRLAASVWRSGIRRVNGSLSVDDSHYDEKTTAPGWGPQAIPRSLGPLSAFALEGNRWRCDKAAVANPAATNAEQWGRVLEEAGVVVGPPIVRLGRVPSDAVEVARHESPPLREIVTEMLKNSNSFISELLTKELGSTVGDPTTAGGLAIVSQVAAQYGFGPLSAADGSGVSALDRVTVDQQLAWLTRLRALPVFGSFLASLPVACRDGTLRRRLCDASTAGKVHAKTGTLPDTVALAGYSTNIVGRAVTFAFILTDVRSIARARRAVDQVVTVLTSFEPAQSPFSAYHPGRASAHIAFSGVARHEG